MEKQMEGVIPAASTSLSSSLLPSLLPPFFQWRCSLCSHVCCSPQMFEKMRLTIS